MRWAKNFKSNSGERQNESMACQRTHRIPEQRVSEKRPSNTHLFCDKHRVLPGKAVLIDGAKRGLHYLVTLGH